MGIRRVEPIATVLSVPVFLVLSSREKFLEKGHHRRTSLLLHLLISVQTPLYRVARYPKYLVFEPPHE